MSNMLILSKQSSSYLSKVHGANTGPTWVLSAPCGPHVRPMNLAIRVYSRSTPNYGCWCPGSLHGQVNHHPRHWLCRIKLSLSSMWISTTCIVTVLWQYHKCIYICMLTMLIWYVMGLQKPAFDADNFMILTILYTVAIYDMTWRNWLSCLRISTLDIQLFQSSHHTIYC